MRCPATARVILAHLCICTALLAPTSVMAQVTPAGAPAASKTTGMALPPVRRIESAQAVSTISLSAITSVRQLSDGRLLLNDGTRRRLLLLDSTLAEVGVVLDSLTEVENAYGTRAGSLIPYRGDSTLFIDPVAYAILVLDEKGRIARVRSVPRAQDVNWLSSATGQYGYPGIDAKGRLVHRIPAQAARPAVAPPSNVPYFPQPPDSAFIVGVNLDTRKVDTLGAVRITKSTFTIRTSADGDFDISSVSSPLPLLDDWAVLPDGTIAFVRGRDYRIEYLNGDGTVTSSEKLPFDWTRMTDDDKTRMMDSIGAVQVKRDQTNFVTNTIVWSNTLSKPFPVGFEVFPGYVLPQGFPGDWILPKGLSFPAGYVFACPPGAPPVAAPAAPAGNTPASASASGTPGTPPRPACVPNPYTDFYGNGYTPTAPRFRPQKLFPALDLPDYRPPLPPNAVRADADGNLWIRTVPVKPVPGGPVFDIVSRQGVLIDRIQLPPGYSLAGFGLGRVVYLSTRDAKGLHLARVRLK